MKSDMFPPITKFRRRIRMMLTKMLARRNEIFQQFKRIEEYDNWPTEEEIHN